MDIPRARTIVGSGYQGIAQDKVIRSVPSLILRPIQSAGIGIFVNDQIVVVIGSVVNIQTASIQILRRHGRVGYLGHPTFLDSSQKVPFRKGASSASNQASEQQEQQTTIKQHIEKK
jgi:hypothetical protein